MRISIASLICFVSCVAISAGIPSTVLKVIPRQYDLESKELADAKANLENEIAQCGAGVVEGARGTRGEPLENRCSYQIKLDKTFFRPTAQKTGLLHDSNWAYAADQSWYLPADLEVPEAFDLRVLMKNGQPTIKTQQCGDCWAWSTHHGLEIARAIHEGQAYDLSVQTVLSCSKAGSCSGGNMSAPKFLVGRGLPNESDFSYKASNARCKYNSTELAKGWEGAIFGAPSIGSSLRYSRYFKGNFREGTHVKEIMAAMYQAKGPAVVTVQAYDISGGGIYNSCSSINSDGNHMVAISGWETVNGKRIAQVWNSWGKGHGVNGISRIQWECGDGKLNRGLGLEARVIQYFMPCEAPKAAFDQARYQVTRGEGVKLGQKQKRGVTCHWSPEEGLSDPNACETIANPEMTTEYHLEAKNTCGTSSAMTLVVPQKERNLKAGVILTPFGFVSP